MWRLVTRLSHFLPAETAHNLSVKALHYGLSPVADYVLLPVVAAGLKFDNPLGLAAGFDKNAEAYQGALRLGFGAVEVGTITPRQQFGNPKPRLFRLAEDEAVINRYGFNSKGMKIAEKNLQDRNKRYGIIGVNIGANRDAVDRVKDYYTGARQLSKVADYLTINLSSPNTPNLCDLQYEDGLKDCLEATFSGRNEAVYNTQNRPPVFVKLSPDMTEQDLRRSMDIALLCGVSGFVLTNTTSARQDNLISPHGQQAGGLSGQPLADQALKIVIAAANHLKITGAEGVTLIGVGGIATAEQAYARLLGGANLIQLYTAMALQGPYMVSDLLKKLRAMMHADGANAMADVSGTVTSFHSACQHSAHIAQIAAKQSKNS